MPERYYRCLCTWPKLYVHKSIIVQMLDCIQGVHAYVIAHEELDCHAYIEFDLGSDPRAQLRTLTNMFIGSNAFNFERVTRRLDTVLSYITKTDVTPIVHNVSPKHFHIKYHLFQILRTTTPDTRYYYSHYCTNPNLRAILKDIDSSKADHSQRRYNDWVYMNRISAPGRRPTKKEELAISEEGWETGKRWLQSLDSLCI